MFQKILVVVFLLTDVASSRFLTCKIDHHSIEEEKKKNYTYDPTVIEFWPDYVPLERWIVTESHCRHDVEIKFIPFRRERIADYDAQRRGILPVVSLHFFRHKQLDHLFDRYANVSEGGGSQLVACSYDSVWYDRPSRFYAHHGFKLTRRDSRRNHTHTGYALVPFLRQVDAVYRDPYDYRIVYVSNEWFYAFGWHEGFDRQGRLSFLWGSTFDELYVDSVLVTHDKAVCRFSNDRVHCSVDERYHHDRPPPAADYPRLPRQFREMFFGTETPAFPLKGSFWMEDRNRTVLLDSNDTFWLYDADYRLRETTPFCEFEGFSTFPCCRRPAAEKESGVTEEEEGSGTIEDDDEEEDESSTPAYEEGSSTTPAYDEEEIYYNSASEFSYFWKSLWGFLLFR